MLSASADDGLTAGLRFCEPCPAGYTCPNTAMTMPTPCGRGYYSADGSSDVTCPICEETKFCEREDTTYLAMMSNECTDGYLCPEGSPERPFNDHDDMYDINNKYSCPPGSYCAGGIETPCARGTYNPLYGRLSVTDCLATPAGFYTDVAGSSDFITNECPQGHWCAQGTKDPQLGTTESTDLSLQNICPRGTFRKTTKGRESDDCGACPSGYYCPEQSMLPMSCPKGYYCPMDTEFPLPCPIGTFGSSERLTARSECQSCYGGRFCSQWGLIEPEGECDPGFYCVDKSMTAVPKTLHVGDIGNICEAGGYCPVATKYPLACLPGYYQVNTR